MVFISQSLPDDYIEMVGKCSSGRIDIVLLIFIRWQGWRGVY
jgi:hypothetical protein